MHALPLITRNAADGDIDWELLLLLARTEAALTWPELAEDSVDRDWTLPDGLDLRHSGDLDWVSRVVANSAATPRPLPEGPYSSTK